jgi:pilus assembly protein Flp/PilA
MRGFHPIFREFMASEGGPTAVEYAILIAAIVTTAFVAAANVGFSAKDAFLTIAGVFTASSGN